MLDVSHPRAIEGLEVRHAGPDVIVHDPANEKVHILNRSAGAVLELCDGSHDLEQIAGELAARTGTPRDRVVADVRAVLDSFTQLGFVR